MKTLFLLILSKKVVRMECLDEISLKTQDDGVVLPVYLLYN